MYSKPLATRMEAPGQAPSRVMRGTPLRGAADFASFLPQNAALPAAQRIPGAANSTDGTIPSLDRGNAQNTLGLNQMRALAALNAVNREADAEQKTATAQQNTGLPLNPRDVFKLLTQKSPDAASAEIAVRARSHRKDNNPKDRAARTLTGILETALGEMRQKTAAASDEAVGTLAAQFESGAEGVAAIGYDRHGGTSYGKYQISSRAGTMRAFISYLKTEAPDVAERLEKAGPMNTGGKRGAMPATWKQLAAEDPVRFEALQDKFIHASHFEPAMRAIAEKSGIAADEMPFALREVVFSTAVQHGPTGAARIVSRAFGQVGETRLDPEKNEAATVAKAQETLIRKIYDNRSGQFRSSTQSVQAAVKNRLKQEMSLAISMLREEHAGA